MNHEGAVNSAAFSPDGKEIVTAGGDSTARLWDIRTDLDIPADLFKKQVMASTGCQLNVETSSIQLIPTEKWYKLKEEYNTKAREHYKICKYHEYNFWSRFNPEEARKIKPKK